MIRKSIIYFVVFSCLFLIVSSLIYTEIENNLNSVLQCTKKIQDKYYNGNILIISTIKQNLTEFLNYETKYTHTLYFGDSLYFPNFWKYKFFIFIIKNAQEMTMILKSLYGTQLWNSRGYYIVTYITNENPIDIFAIAWKYFIYNINVINMNQTNTNILTYFPYKNKLCGKYAEYEIISSCENELSVDLFPNKIPDDLGNCKIKFMAYPMLPYVKNLNTDREKPSNAGLEITIVHVLGQRMNFEAEYVAHNHAFWGFKDLNGKYQFMFGSLFRRECEVTLGMQFGNASHIVDFDGGFVHLIDNSVWWVPKALPIAQWKNITTIFNGDVWLAILIVLLVNGFSWWFIGRKRETDNSFNDIVLSMMNSLYTMLQGSVVSPTKFNMRLIFIIWLISCLLLFTAHQSQLVSILTSPLYEKQIDSLEQVVNSSLKYGMFVGAALAFEEVDNWVHVKILKNYFQCPLSNLCTNRTAFNRDFAAFRNYRNMRYFLPRYYTSAQGKLVVYPLQFDRLGIWVRFYMLKGYPLLDRFNSLLMRMSSNGLISKWDDEIGIYHNKYESQPDHEPLNLSHVQAAFFILIFGLAASILVLFLELLISCIKRKHKY